MKLEFGAPRLTAILAATAAMIACNSPIRTTAQAVGPTARDATTSNEPVSAATVFSDGVVSDGNEQWRITFSADGKTAYFAESPGFFPITRKATIYVTQFVDGDWSSPQVAPFSGVYADIDPFLSPDGQRLYFSSIRPVDGVMRGDIDIWYIERTAHGWGEPSRLGNEVNGPADELYPSASADGTLYFASGPIMPQPGSHWDIYTATRVGDGFAPRQPLGPAVNTVPGPGDAHLQSAWDFNPEISVDGKTLVFTSLRPGFGFGDLYVSHFRNGEWTQAANLGPSVNTASDEFHPTLARNGRELYFVRRIPASGNFYVIPTNAIPALKP